MANLETDEDGQVIVHPLLGVTTTALQSMNVALTVGYLRVSDERARVDACSIAFVLTPEQCLDLAAMLQQAGTLLRRGPEGRPQ